MCAQRSKNDFAAPIVVANLKYAYFGEVQLVGLEKLPNMALLEVDLSASHLII